MIIYQILVGIISISNSIRPQFSSSKSEIYPFIHFKLSGRTLEIFDVTDNLFGGKIRPETGRRGW